ncbi:Geranylgeranyl transferase type-1 subunit beta [Chamberlinius hualienensis]
MAANELMKSKHVKYFQRCLQVLPSRFGPYDTTRLALAFFSISGLDILQSLHVLDHDKEAIIDWIYSLQVLPCKDGSNINRCGFRGSTIVNRTSKNDERDSSESSVPHDCGHIAMTYTGLASLVILGDDLSRVNKSAIIAGLKSLQLADGSYLAVNYGSENDMRFVYCAAAICYMLQDWDGMDIASTLSYIKDSIAYDHGIGQGLFSESHGGLAYCAIATLALLDKVESTLSEDEIRRVQRWCMFRQQSGFQGRPNKPEDTCYSFWVGASLKLLGIFDLVDKKQNREFILSTQNSMTGGLAKFPDIVPDPLHTYTGLGGLALMSDDGLNPINAALNITERASEHLLKIHQKWRLVR